MDNNQNPNNKDPQWNNTQQFVELPYGPPWQSGQMHSYNQPNKYMYHYPPNRTNQGPVIGLQALCAACTRIYPDQPNPLQVTARIKYWLGGPDPLDYISMYWNTGCKDLNIPPHWHYISFGLSDLHGDGRVHPPPPRGQLPPDHISGLGLEISFRILGDPRQPPTWPAALLQRLATYVFNTGNRLCVGDHISWHSALDGSDEADSNLPTKTDDRKKRLRKSKIRHMLIAQDPQLDTVDTPLGKVQFVQIVGVTDRELKAAQRSGGTLILETLARDARFGGPWFITDMDRRQSATLPNNVNAASDLSGVAAICRWEYWEPNTEKPNEDNLTHRNSSELPQNVKEQIKCILQKGLSEISLQSSKEIKEESPDNKDDTSVRTGVVNNNECKMSTDSEKFLPFDISFLKASPLHTICDGNIKDLTMSTDSFEMSKIGAALIEDIKQNELNSENNNKDGAASNLETFNNDVNELGKSITNPPQQNNEIWTQDAVSFQGVHLIFDQESGSMLPLALRCRILHGRHFTWKSVGEVQAITLVATNVSGAIVSSEHPIAANNGWLQILIPNDFAEEMATDLEGLINNADDNSDNEESPTEPSANPANPSCFVWPHKGLKISIVRNAQ